MYSAKVSEELYTYYSILFRFLQKKRIFFKNVKHKIEILQTIVTNIFKILDKGNMPMFKALVLRDKIQTLTLK